MDINSFDWYKGNLLWLKPNTIFLTKHGSHAYGTNLPTSDLDVKGVCIPPKEYWLGYLNHFEQAEVREPIDCVIYDIRKFFNLASDCNPNVIELLFVSEQDWYHPAGQFHPWWEEVVSIRDLFISKKARHTFSGYAIAQLKRINTHRKYLLNPPKGKPDRVAMGLPDGQKTLSREDSNLIDSQIRKLSDDIAGKGNTKDKIEEIDSDLVEAVVEKMNLSKDLIPLIIAERRYNNLCREWDSYQKWKLERNENRASLEAKHGYDTKHAMHLVRLMRMCKEILETGKVLVKRPDADELLAIRNGVWDYDTLMSWAKSQDEALDAVYATSTLPNSADKKNIDNKLIELVEGFLF